MKQSELNHLRRLLGWVACEIGQDPQELTATVLSILDDGISDAAKRRLVESHDKARNVPQYVREAVKALRPLVGPGDVVEDARPFRFKITSEMVRKANDRMMGRLPK